METITVNTSELHSSVHQVLSNEDLLSKILLPFPVLSILPLKLVSKQWLSLINSSNFITLHRNQNPNIEPPFGLFLELKRSSVEYDYVRLDNANSSPLHINIPFGSDLDNVEILHSCNGLLLCVIRRPFKFIVYNPSMNLFKVLPECSNSELVKLVFDPTKSPHYKVIHVEFMLKDVDPFVEIKTYSSQTGSWTVSPHRFLKFGFLDFDQGVYFDGAIHWVTTRNLHYKLDVNHLVLTSIRNPPVGDGSMHYDHKLFESRGCLLLSCIVVTRSTRKGELNVYEMKNGSLEWSVKYLIDLAYCRKLIPAHWNTPGGGNRIFFNCISVGEREEDSFIVIHVYGKVILYKFLLKTVSKIYDFIPPIPEPIDFHCFPFIPSLAGV